MLASKPIFLIFLVIIGCKSDYSGTITIFKIKLEHPFYIHVQFEELEYELYIPLGQSPEVRGLTCLLQFPNFDFNTWNKDILSAVISSCLEAIVENNERYPTLSHGKVALFAPSLNLIPKIKLLDPNDHLKNFLENNQDNPIPLSIQKSEDKVKVTVANGTDLRNYEGTVFKINLPRTLSELYLKERKEDTFCIVFSEDEDFESVAAKVNVLKDCYSCHIHGDEKHVDDGRLILQAFWCQINMDNWMREQIGELVGGKNWRKKAVDDYLKKKLKKDEL